MGYGGKVVEQRRARELRAEAWTLQDIATELGVSKASVSLWVRDVAFTPRPRNRGHANHQEHPLHTRKVAEIERCETDGRLEIGVLNDRELLMVGLALYAGEGSKTDGGVRFANSDPRMIVIYLRWLRRFFDIDESRLRVKLYLHENLDLEETIEYWADLTGIPHSQFTKPYRAANDPTIRRTKHRHGCPSIAYSCTTTHRRVMGMIAAILSPSAIPG